MFYRMKSWIFFSWVENKIVSDRIIEVLDQLRRLYSFGQSCLNQNIQILKFTKMPRLKWAILWLLRSYNSSVLLLELRSYS